MKSVLVGDCKPDRLFLQEDASSVSEAQFEVSCVKALSCILPTHLVIRFEVGFEHEGRTFLPDLAAIARDFSHWFVIEVELASHSFDLHVLPQVKALRYGEIDIEHAANVIAERVGISVGQARTIVSYVPRNVVVVANRHNVEWDRILGSHDIQFLAVTTYCSSAGEIAYEISGRATAAREVVGWGTYSLTDRSIRLPIAARLPPEAAVQIEDPYGAVSWWTVIRQPTMIWLTKQVGILDLPPDQPIQIVKTFAGRLSMRLPK